MLGERQRNIDGKARRYPTGKVLKTAFGQHAIEGHGRDGRKWMKMPTCCYSMAAMGSYSDYTAWIT